MFFHKRSARYPPFRLRHDGCVVTDRKLSPDEERAWAQVARSIKTLEPSPPAPQASSSKPTKRPRRTTPAQQSATQPYTVPTAAQPADRARERRVRRGQLVISATLDLHGHTQASADTALNNFLARQKSKSSRCVLIITGKGRSGEGVIRRNFLHWLRLPQARQLVSGYAQAHQKHGGSGAFYVFLRRSAKS